MALDRVLDAQFDERERRYDREREILGEAARAVLSHRALKPLAGEMCRLATELVGASTACVMTWNNGEYVRAAAFGERVEALLEASGFDTRYRLEGKPDAGIERRVQRLKHGPGFVVVPLGSTLREEGEKIDGFLLVGSNANERFNRSDFRVLQELGALLAVALRNFALYEAMERANRALQESSEFKSDLLAMLAHDFKGPLTVIIGYCELLLGGDGEQREEIEMIHAQTQRLVRLSDDALVLAQTQAEGFSLARRVVDLAEFVVECVAASLPNNPRVVVDLPSQPLPVEIDPPRFRHVVDNLVWNALKYSTGEARVTVRADGANAVIEISDAGIGIPADELPTLFTRFGRASNARRRGIAGSGIGLYVARKIVSVHRGSLGVRSTENVGSTFTVTLPWPHAAPPRQAPRTRRASTENR